jgi:hypothetical protein
VDARPWLEQVRAELARRKLPPLYSERLLSELSDHITDFTEDSMSTDTCHVRDAVRPMGVPADIADSAAKEYSGRNFWGRHPLLAFIAMPIVVLPLLWAAMVMLFIWTAQLIGLSEDGGASFEQLPNWLSSTLPSVVFAIVVIPLGIAAALVCRVARKAGRARWWPLVACTLLAIIGGMTFFDVALPGTHRRGVLHDSRIGGQDPELEHRSAVCFGFGVGKYPKWWQLTQFALPLAIGVWAVHRQGRDFPRFVA